jgi:hypothetical protein
MEVLRKMGMVAGVFSDAKTLNLREEPQYSIRQKVCRAVLIISVENVLPRSRLNEDAPPIS